MKHTTEWFIETQIGNAIWGAARQRVAGELWSYLLRQVCHPVRRQIDPGLEEIIETLYER